MSEKRRDSKGRLLWPSEIQRADGRYEYRYTDKNGERRSVYSWRLVSTDPIPSKKRRNIEPLRDLEKRINKDLDDGLLVYELQKMLLNTYWDKYIALKLDLKETTRSNYIYNYDRIVRPDLGKRKLADIKYSDIKKLYMSLIYEKGFKPHSMEIVHTILHPVFASAVRDGLIRLNPTDGIMADIKRSNAWEVSKRQALTIPQQEALISFLAHNSNYKHWLPLFTVLLGTGGRIGEILGLRWEDCDFERDIISINHTLVYRKLVGQPCKFIVTTPKTKSGIRVIPMLSEVKEAFMQEYKRQLEEGFNTSVIDGYSGFIFKSRYNTALSPHCFNRAIERIIKAYNADEAALARSQNREPFYLPHFSAHTLRHTFCTRFCENESNLKVIQEIMGHADITTTMDIYNEATLDKKIESFAALEGKIKIK